MGVHGLATFLKENRRALSRTLVLSTANDDEGEDVGIKLVVDGWSFIYTVLSYSGDPCIYGGECDVLCEHVEDIVSSWISVGINLLTFVFDGPYPPLKYKTVISRLQESCVKPANLFFRTSPAARSTRRFLAENCFLTPLAYQSVVSALLSMGPSVQVEIADKEADPYIVSLAAAQGAYVAGNDSDFLVLYCEGCKGYVPFEEMTWVTSGKKDVHLSTPLAGDEDDGFQTITKKKQKGISVTPGVEYGNGILPPTSPIYSNLVLLLRVYEPAVFAKYISLPPTLLPLLGSLIGNDYATFDFFRRGETTVERITRVASTFSSVLKDVQSGNIKKLRKIYSPGKSAVIDVIGTTVERLLVWRDPVNSPESSYIGEITAKVVQSTLQYSLEDTASLLPRPRNQNTGDAAEKIRQLYLEAYHKGTLNPRIMDVFTGGACFPRFFLEDPDRECCARSIGRPVREIVWGVFSNGGGIPERSSLSEDDEEDVRAPIWLLSSMASWSIQQEAPVDEEELVDVVEETFDEEVSVANDDDPLAVLRGRLQRLSFSGVEVEQIPDATDVSAYECDAESQNSKDDGEEIKPALSKSVTEYIRRGTRIVGEDVEVRPLHVFLPGDFLSDTPVQLTPPEQRLRVFLQALGSNTNAIRELAAEESRNIESGGRLLAVVALRWVLKTLHTRLEAASDSNRRRDRDQERWTRSEAQAFLASLYEEGPADQPPTIENRAVQLTAQLLAALDACAWLAQALLLVDPPGVRRNVVEEPNLPFRLGETERLFSGQRFHYALHRSRLGATKVLPPSWNAVEEGLEGTFKEEKRRETKGRHKKKGSDKVTIPPGMFGVLSLDIE